MNTVKVSGCDVMLIAKSVEVINQEVAIATRDVSALTCPLVDITLILQTEAAQTSVNFVTFLL